VTSLRPTNAPEETALGRSTPAWEIRRRTTCRLCDDVRLRLLFSLVSTPLANALVDADRTNEAQPVYPLDVHFCDHCFHVQLLDVVNPEILFRDYVYVSGTSPSFVDHFRRYAEDVLARTECTPGQLVVDIGSNDGTLLRFFKDKGCRVLGVEPATLIAERADAAGIETISAFLNEEVAHAVARDYGSAAIVTANNVFAHVDDLHGFVEAVKVLLAEDGVFVFEVSYLLDVFEKTLFDTIYHEHLSYHSVKPLTTFFERHDMELVDVQRVSSHGGSLRGFAQRKAASRKKPTVDSLIKTEAELGLHGPAAYRTFFQNIDQRRNELRSLLQRLRSEGRRVVGFGAPAKATTLMYHFGLGTDVLEYVVDDSPLKQGLFTPGLHVPIVPSSRLYESPPDYVLILAWNFAESIIRSHEAYSKLGGKFIVPLPTLKVY
jgi:SAM-dependent methyltransferase